jgi:hypothetical protein
MKNWRLGNLRCISYFLYALVVKIVLQREQQHTPKVQRWQQPSDPPHLCHFSGLSRATRQHKMSIRRLAPSHPPAISADKMQNLQQM